ncbi:MULTISPECIES: DUF4145 domain-containing protein [unclassified Flavobacterium]|nr:MULTISPECIES: DUF4145 domain-containing protein [unclassified Flavobacterium]KOP37776.1 hypothetical protein AKO67_12890 [Flavobacterium sp. VMW]OWU90993.1 hypothetical protein APR43_11005 [Flavobacterium sp. NLM]
MEEKHFCRTCKGLRNHKELHTKKLRSEDDDDFFIWFEQYSIIECLGCETISFLKIYGDTEMVDYDEHGSPEYYYDKMIFPPYLSKGRELELQNFIPENIRGIYIETISAFKADLSILTAGGLRAIIEALCNHLKIKNDNLSVRIDLLHKKGHLTLSESKRLHSIRFMGNDALHEIVKPNKDHLFLLLEIINHLLANLFINDKIIKGKVETLIDNYDEFLRLLKTKITVEIVEKKLTLLEVLGKSKKLLSKENILEYEKKFIDEINDSKYDFIKSENEDGINYYEIIKVPSVSYIF